MSKTPVAPRFARYFPFFGGGGGGGGGGGVRPTAPPGYATVGGSIFGRRDQLSVALLSGAQLFLAQN